jgi:hypothetical protein
VVPDAVSARVEVQRFRRGVEKIRKMWLEPSSLAFFGARL